MIYEEYVTFKKEWFHLRGKLYYDESLGSVPAVVLCSPHPHLGGDVENNVIVHVARSLSKCGAVVMTFDYAGVGNSEGPWKNELEKFEFWESIMGSEDYKTVIPDAKAAFEHLLKCFPNPPKTLLVGGYSFGAIVALRLASTRKTDGVFCISPPVSEYEMSFVKSLDCPKYFIFSDEDIACTVDEAKEFFNPLSANARLSIIPGAGHFYVGMESVLCATLGVLLSLRLTESHLTPFP